MPSVSDKGKVEEFGLFGLTKENMMKCWYINVCFLSP